MKRLTTLLLALAGVTTTGCLAEVGGNECTSDRCTDDGSGSNSTAEARDCSDETKVKLISKDITIDSDADFANLPKEAKAGCWELDGVLHIDGDNVTSLEKLGDLISVNDIEITGTTLTTLDFLQNDVKVYGFVKVLDNDSLTSLAPLRAARFTGDVIEAFVPAIELRNNLELTTIDDIKAIPEIKGDLQVHNNPKLEALELRSLTKIDGDLRITQSGMTLVDLSQLESVRSIEVSQNPNLTSFMGLQTTIITGNVIFRQNTRLSMIGSMFSLTLIGGNLIVDDNDALTSLSGLISSMQRINGTVTISNNQVLTDLGQLSRTMQGIFGTVTVTNNPVLGYCKAYEVDRCINTGTVTNTGNGPQTSCNTWCP